MSYRDIVNAGFSSMSRVGDLFDLRGWKWPHEWIIKFPALQDIPVPRSSKSDKLVWLDTYGTKQDFLVSVAWNSLRYRDIEVSWEKVV